MVKKIIRQHFLKLETRDVQGIPFIFSLSLVITLFFLSGIDDSLTRFTDRAIGIAILNGVDPAIRQTEYFSALLLFAFSFFILKSYYSILLEKLEQHYEDDFVKKVVQVMSELGYVWLFTLIYQVYSLYGDNANDLIKISSLYKLSIPTILGIEFMFMTVLFGFMPKTFKAHVNQHWTIWFFLFLPIVLLYTLSYLRPFENPEQWINMSRFILVYFLSLFIFFIFSKYKIKEHYFHLAMMPLFTLPILSIIASEFQYAFKAHMNITTYPLTLGLIIFMVMVSVALVLIAYWRKKTVNILRLIDYVSLPILIAVFFILNYHQEILHVGFLDLVGMGNKVVPVQQFLQYGSIPLVDYWGAQHFEFGVLLYALLNGFNALEPILWVQLRNLIMLLIFYFSFRNLWGRSWTFLFIIFLPSLSWINPYYFGAFLPMLCFKRLYEKKSILNFSVITLLSLISFVWMPSMGKISIIAVFILMLAILRTKIDIKNFIIGSLGSIGFTVGVYVILLLIKQINILDQITLIKAFSAIDYNVGSYPSLIAGDTPAWKIMSVYGIFPLIYLSFILYYIFKKNKEYSDYFLLFMVIASLVSSLRSLGRHSLYEGEIAFDFIPLILLSLILSEFKFRESLRHAMFIGFSVFILLFFDFTSPILALNYHKPSTRTYTLDEKRYIPEKELYPTQLVKLLKSALKENQTFYDNINGNLIFELSEKKQPFLHHSAQMIYSQPPQEVYIDLMDQKYQADELPIIIFDGWWWGSETDGIPTEFSTFKLTEYIYDHYHPWISIDGFDLWVANNSYLSSEFDLTDYNAYHITKIQQTFNLLKLPYIWATYDEAFTLNKLQVLEELEINQDINHLNIEFNSLVIEKKSNYVWFEIFLDSDSEYSATLSYAQGNSVNFTLLPGLNQYAIRLSSQYAWFNAETTHFTLHTEAAAVLNTFKLIQGD